MSADRVSADREVTTPSYWAARIPALEVSRRLELGRVARLAVAPTETATHVARMRREGYFAAPAILPAERLGRLRDGIAQVRASVGHEIFTLLFDEPWRCLAEIAALIEPVLGRGPRVVPMPYVNVVPPGDAGFAPHRDRYVDPLTPDGLPRYVTAWLSLTDATPERACLSLLPACFDPCFPHELTRLAVRDLRDLRAVPVPAGSLVCFNQALMHWGNRNAATETRLSFAFELERAGLEQPRSPSVSLDEALSFAARCRFVGEVVEQLARNNIAFTDADLALAAQLRGVEEVPVATAHGGPPRPATACPP